MDARETSSAFCRSIATGAKHANDAKDDDSFIVEETQITFIRDDRRYRIRGLEKNKAIGSLKVNILASRDDLVHLDAIDLVKARSRASFIKATAAELFVDADIVKQWVKQWLGYPDRAGLSRVV